MVSSAVEGVVEAASMPSFTQVFPPRFKQIHVMYKLYLYEIWSETSVVPL